MTLAVTASRRKLPRESELGSGAMSDLSRHLLRAQEEERKRISRELHDEAGQGLMVLRLYLGMIASESRSSQEGRKIQEAMGMLDRTIGDLRRIIARLSPRTLDEMGLLPAIRREARELCRTTGMKAQLLLPEQLNDMDHEYEVAIYRSVQEALNNIAKHSQARKFTVTVAQAGGHLRLAVEDDGVGFSRAGSASQRSFGIVGMRERIAALGGSLRIRSRKGQGTRLQVLLPLPSAASGHKRGKRAKNGKPVQNPARDAKKNHDPSELAGLMKSPQPHHHGNQMHSS